MGKERDFFAFGVAAAMAVAAAGCAPVKKPAPLDGAGERLSAAGPTPMMMNGDRSHIISSEARIAGQAVGYLPKGVVYRMSGDYSQNVPVTLAPDGTLLSYPAPGDVRVDASPVPLAGGWWLDRRGVSAGTVFTSYTYSEYASLPEAPSPAALLEAVIPGARVTAVMQLPVTMAQAEADTAAVNAWIRSRKLFP